MTDTNLALLDDAGYERLHTFAVALDARTDHADAAASAIAERVALLDARLLDNRQHHTWLDLFTDDCVYWVPSSESIEDPTRVQVSYLLDDRRRLEDRVALLDTGWAHAQIPPSLTQRVVTGVEGWFEADGSVSARASAVIWDWRRDVMTPHPATLFYRLNAPGTSADERTWSIEVRVVRRLAADGSVGNIAFVL